MIDYQERFYAVLRQVESNLDADLNTEKLSQRASLSKYHFHRQFSAFLGMSVYSLVKLLRLKRAAFQLAYRNGAKVMDIAIANGYDSSEAFARAFRKVFQQSPSSFRKNPDWSSWSVEYDPIVKLRNRRLNRHGGYDVRVVEFPETPVALLEHTGALERLSKSIKVFIDWRKVNALPPGKAKTFNLVYSDPNITALGDYRFGICCAFDGDIAKNNAGVVGTSIPKGRCAVVRHIGSDDTIDAVVDYLYSAWLIENGFELRDFPIIFERVNVFPDVPESELVTDVYLPIT